MFLDYKQTAEDADSRIASRRKVLTSLIAGGGALVLAACGGEGGASSDPAAVDKRSKRNPGGASAASAVTAPATSTIGTGSTTVGAAVQQMQLPHEATPNGVPGGYDWAEAPVIQNATPPANFSAMTGWGQIQAAAGLNVAAVAATVQLRNFRTYFLNSSGQLILGQNDGSLGGSLMLPTFANNTSFATQMTNSGGVTTVGLDPTKAFQFWPSNRAPIPAGTQGMVCTVEAQLVAPTSKSPSDYDTSYILALGSDWWESMTAVWDNYITSAGVGTGRFVYLTTDWQGFTFTSIQNASASVSATSFAY